MKLPSLSVFFPVFNEAENIPLIVKEAQEILPLVAQKFEIIIVDDGSIDQSAAVAKRLAAHDSRIILINHQKNLGYGAALQSGIKASRYQWIFFTDGDWQFRLEQLKEFIKYIDNYQVIIGYRTKRVEGGLRAFNARLFKLYIDLLFRVHVKDIDCAFKLFKADLIKNLPLISTGAVISSEILYRLKKKRIKFKQLPVTHYPRQYGQPTGNNFQVIIKAAWESLKLYLNVKIASIISL